MQEMKSRRMGLKIILEQYLAWGNYEFSNTLLATEHRSLSRSRHLRTNLSSLYV